MIDLKLLFFGFIPEWFFAAYLGLAFFGIRLNWRKHLQITLVLAVAGYLTKSFMVSIGLSGFHILLYLLTLILVYRYLVSLKWSLATASAISVFIYLFTTKFLLMNTVLNYFHTSYEVVVTNPWLEVKVSNGIDLIVYVTSIMFILTGFKIADFSKPVEGIANLESQRNKIEKDVLFTVNIILLNLLLTLLLVFYHYMWEKGISYLRILSIRNTYIMFTLFGIIIFIGTAALVIYISKQLKTIRRLELKEAKIMANQQLAEILLNEEAEFKRQLGLIARLIKEGDKEDLKEYLNEVSEKTLVINPSINKLPELKALLVQKAIEADKNEIFVKYNFISSLDNINLTSVDLVRILGNLLDNAIDALVETDSNKKELLLNCYETKDQIIFEIFNNEPVIPMEIQQLIFEKGISTKAKEGRGYGLAIVKEIAEKNMGHVELRSEEGSGTLFTVIFPIKNKEIA